MSFCSWEGDEIYRDHFKSGIIGPLIVIKDGIYVCSECSYELFSSKQKYEHSSPWPAFTETIHEDSVSKVAEMGSSHALKVSCGKCGNPLGHEFLKAGPDQVKSRF